MVKPQTVAQLAQKYGYQEYMVDRYLELFGEATEEFLQGNDVPLPKTIRINTLATAISEGVSRLQAKGIGLEAVAGLPYAYSVSHSPLPLGATTEYLLGYYMLQSVASMWAVEVLKPRAGQLVVDMCAAPGGKATAIAQLMENQGALIATDISRERTRSLRSNLSRMRVDNTITLRMDAAQLPDLGVHADAVLLDAPCTGEGLIPVDPSRKQSRSAADIQTMTQVQRKLILAASELVHKGGVVVYSTCSLAPEENEEIINYALQRCSLRIVDTNLPLGEPGFTAPFNRELDKSLRLARRFYPYKHRMEGFFICKMIKSDN